MVQKLYRNPNKFTRTRIVPKQNARDRNVNEARFKGVGSRQNVEKTAIRVRIVLKNFLGKYTVVYLTFLVYNQSI